MRVGGGFGLEEELVAHLRAVVYDLVDFGAHELSSEDDYPDFVIPLARAVTSGTVERGIAVCGSGVGASVYANKIPGIPAALVHDHFSARQGVEDGNMNIIGMGGPCWPGTSSRHYWGPSSVKPSATGAT
jgi:ribose 5-phosphate isomerase B